ncbi:hypothetical protein MTO96_005071 [Rhipicephalus appendiculatus]
MKTLAPTDLVCDTQTGATCHLFADTTGGTLKEPAAISHASGEATASMATTADDAPVLLVVELPAYDPPATLTYGQHASPLTRPPVPAAQGGCVATYVPSHDLAQPRPPANPDLLPNISGDRAEELEDHLHSPHDIGRRCGSHQCCSSPWSFPSARDKDVPASVSSMYTGRSCRQPISVLRTCPAAPLYSPSEIAVCVAKPFFRHGHPIDHQPACSCQHHQQAASNSHRSSRPRRSRTTFDACPHQPLPRSAPYSLSHFTSGDRWCRRCPLPQGP